MSRDPTGEGARPEPVLSRVIGVERPHKSISLRNGGHLEKEYDEIRGTLDFRDTHLPQMLEMARSRLDVKVRTLMMDADRELIASSYRDVPEPRIVITHGTDTMSRLGDPSTSAA